MFRSEYLDLQDGRLFYSISGTGKPIVLLHGNFNDHQIWSEQVNVLSAHYQVIHYDLRGYGHSSTPSTSFSNVEDLHSLINYLSLDHVTLIGSSSGGSIAVDFTLSYPQRVQDLILVSPSISGNRYPLSMTLQGIRNFIHVRWKGAEAAIESFITNRYWQYFFPDSSKNAAREAVLHNVRNTNNFCRFPPALSTTIKPYAIHRLHEIAVPTLVITSDHDHPYNRRTAEVVSQTIPKAEKYLFSRCGHLPFAEEPEQFNQVVLNYMEKA